MMASLAYRAEDHDAVVRGAELVVFGVTRK
jgi:hypothetical protein